MTNGGDNVFLLCALASANSMALGASALWGVRCTFPYQQPVLLCLCLACVYNMLYECMSSIELYYVVSWSVGIETRRYTGSRESEKMENRHVSLPGRYSDGDFTDWLERFEICAAANEWDKKTRALKLPTLLEKEALVAWLSIPEETRKDYDEVKRSLCSALKPNQFSSFAEFQARKLRPGETVQMYLHHLQRLLESALPDLDGESKDKLLFQQFLAGVPDECSRALRSNPDITTTTQVVARARLLMSVSVEKPSSSATMAVGSQCSEIADLKEDVKRLSEQMAALVNKFTPAEQTAAAVASPSVSVRCYNCNGMGHLSRNCRQRRQQAVCYKCNRPGHVARYCETYQGNGLGTTPRATSRSGRC